MDKKGVPRPEGYKFQIEPREAAIVSRIFSEYQNGNAITRIVKTLNEEGVPGRSNSKMKWAHPSSFHGSQRLPRGTQRPVGRNPLTEILLNGTKSPLRKLLQQRKLPSTAVADVFSILIECHSLFFPPQKNALFSIDNALNH